MAEFSLEYVEATGDVGHDFSIKEVFESLDGFAYRPIICEGFGIIAVGNFGGRCFVFYKEDWIELNSFIESRIWEK